MTKSLKLLSLFTVLTSTLVFSDAVPGKTAPDFKLPDIHGKTQSLSALKGKTVVLEWTNYECPFVKKHYDSKNMQELQKKYTEKGIVWFSINSSAKGKQGHYPNEKWLDLSKKMNVSATNILIDTDGKVGKMYGAATTPHMFIIDKAGILVYAGGIDDKTSTEISDIAKAKNYVSLALDELLAGKAVSTSESTPYGCSVKY